MKRLLFILLTAGLLLPAFSVSAQPASKTRVIILHLNDMHAKTEGFAKLKYLADSLRKSNPYVFIVSAGDNFTGNPYIDMVADKGSPMIDLMNKAGFSLSCFGNHEFDLGQGFLEKRLEQAKFPFICANINTASSGIKKPQPYFILKAGSLQIPVFGLIEVNDKGIPDTHPSKAGGLSFSNPLQAAGEYVGLKKKYGSLIALTHLGTDVDKKLAQDYPQIDVIIGGHSHTILKKGLTENGVLIAQAGSYQRFIGKLTLDFAGNAIESKSDTLYALDAIKGSDASMLALVKSYENNPEFQKVAGIAAGSVSGKQNLGALMTDAVAWAVKADFAFQNKGGIRIHSLQEGEIQVKDIYRLDPFGNLVVIYKMTGREIESLILNSYKRDSDIDLIPAGMSYTIEKGGKGKRPKLRMTGPGGKSVVPDKTYTVALNSYISAAYTFDHQDPGTTLETTTEECLIRFLEYKKTVRYKDADRAKLR